MPWLIVAGMGALGFSVWQIRGAARDLQEAKPSPLMMVLGGLLVLALLRKRGR